ncbi:hypothetical protein [Streptomyces sp. NPDC088727]|uniref:hypothetical protein n=1 Tax=Streptomyces sp. NPDC088727 TaxID=3365875 RepID=UPI003815750A
MSEQSGITVVHLGNTIHLTHARADGGELQMFLTRGTGRTTSVYAVTAPTGQLRTVSARSWANQHEEPQLTRQMSAALTQADR